MLQPKPEGITVEAWISYCESCIANWYDETVTRRINEIAMDDRRACYAAAKQLVERQGYLLNEQNRSGNVRDWSLDFREKVLRFYENLEIIRAMK